MTDICFCLGLFFEVKAKENNQEMAGRTVDDNAPTSAKIVDTRLVEGLEVVSEGGGGVSN